MSNYSTQKWAVLKDELDLWASKQRRATLWLRDDDAVEPTTKLDRLDQLCQHHNAPYTIATIPSFSTPALADWCSSRPLCSVGVHGVGHHNHAPAGQKKCELGLHRGLDVILDELVLARQNTQTLFKDNFVDMLVPPWNRIDGDLIPHLSAIGFKSLSTYGWPRSTEPARIFHLNTHVDIIDWKGTRGGLPVDILVADLVNALKTARDLQYHLPIGILTHHLVHDDLAWTFLQELKAFCEANENIEWVSAKAYIPA